MQQPEPMSHFMRRCTALIVRVQVPARKGTSSDDTPIFDDNVVAGADVGREVAVAEKTSVGELGQEVEVEVCVCASTERGFHLHVVVSCRPVLVHGPAGVYEGKANPMFVVILIKDIDL